MLLLVSLACRLQRPPERPGFAGEPPANQQNQDPQLPPPTNNSSAEPLVPSVVTQTIGANSAGRLEILSPLEGATVSTAQIEVRGVAAPGAVVTVNDEILIAGPDGLFSAVISLEVGLNLIEIIASDSLGNEAVVELTIIYEPS